MSSGGQYRAEHQLVSARRNRRDTNIFTLVPLVCVQKHSMCFCKAKVMLKHHVMTAASSKHSSLSPSQALNRSVNRNPGCHQHCVAEGV